MGAREKLPAKRGSGCCCYEVVSSYALGARRVVYCMYVGVVAVDELEELVENARI